MNRVFIGSEALAAGELTEHELRRWYRPVYRGVYVAASVDPSLGDRTWAAWLWSGRRAVISGLAAAALHGSQWVDVGEPIELIGRNSRPHDGLLVRNETLISGEVTKVSGLPVTTPVRTAFDLGRHLRAETAIARLDALKWATFFSIDDVMGLACEHPGARGLRQLKAILPLVDGGAASPKETWLRMLLIDGGFPPPTTQIPVMDGWRILAVLDMGWDDIKVAVEYDGDHHRTNRAQYVKDQRRIRRLEQLGWIVIRVIAEDRPDDVVRQVREAIRRRTSPRSTVA
ncbi:hypothetical protein Y900_025865 [Mycolicibacterium aromaticivorans JS19b1 = JCM 16368]|uniref:DUF559 domain-containing protein n=1 Tax=Mycolicibacterium aromaticivorans JS19b1 = JCM 16368 TaxID=1440774 RepID=A0A064CTY4_9MYCO|nr:DUF559 domain-containing protein [Mycolicibacterium aromaticivorans]KDF02268.1 hypothetical protein Y900_025865 [Mycolicibacterium aromaticivorans JS19b1 = JCM 16368]